jgi:hypothetical protein
MAIAVPFIKSHCLYSDPGILRQLPDSGFFATIAFMYTA